MEVLCYFGEFEDEFLVECVEVVFVVEVDMCNGFFFVDCDGVLSW